MAVMSSDVPSDRRAMTRSCVLAPGASVRGAINSTPVTTGGALGVVGLARLHDAVTASVRNESATNLKADLAMIA